MVGTKGQFGQYQEQLSTDCALIPAAISVANAKNIRFLYGIGGDDKYGDMPNMDKVLAGRSVRASAEGFQDCV